MPPISKPESPDEVALDASLEGIDHPHDFYEVVYTGELDIARLFPLNVFPAVRTLYRSIKFTIVRLYIGGVTTTDEQEKALLRAYATSVILDYHRTWSPDE